MSKDRKQPAGFAREELALVFLAFVLIMASLAIYHISSGQNCAAGEACPPPVQKHAGAPIIEPLVRMDSVRNG